MFCALSRSVVSDPCDPIDCSPPGSAVHWNFQARRLEWAATSFSRGPSQPMHQPRSPTLQADSLPSEPRGKPKNSAVGTIFLLRGSSQPKNQSWLSCIAGRLYRLIYEGSPLVMDRQKFLIWLEV